MVDMGTTLDAYIPCDDDGEQHPDYVSPGGFGARAKRNAPQTLLHAVDDLVTLLAEQRENAA
jgi:hypothetical protein